VIKLVIIQGSVREGNYTAKAAALVADELKSRDGVSCQVVDPGQLRLPFPGQKAPGEDGEKLRMLVSEATGVVLATPEYHGSLSSVMKLVVENLGFPSVLAGKPVALLGVAAGQIGAIKSLEALEAMVREGGG